MPVVNYLDDAIRPSKLAMRSDAYDETLMRRCDTHSKQIGKNAFTVFARDVDGYLSACHLSMVTGPRMNHWKQKALARCHNLRQQVKL